MAVLLVELHGNRRGSVLPGRVLIGRRAMNHLVIDHPAVSRLHAWIDGEGDRYYLSDAGSRTGTTVNGQRVIARHLLGDGDEIAVGPARLTFLAEPRVRAGVEAFDLSAGPAAATGDDGILFRCPSCTAPLWAAKEFAGRTGACKYCGGDMTVPRPRKRATAAGAAPLPPPAPVPGRDEPALDLAADRDTPRDRRDGFADPLPVAEAAAAPHPAAPAPVTKVRAVDQTCGVCQSPISVFEEQTTCPSCGLVFHAECWAENYGCSAYGCPQVDALKPQGSHHPHGPDDSGGAGSGAGVSAVATAGDHGDPAGAAMEQLNRFPWEFLLLAGSVFAALLGALTFGLPSLALAGGSVAYIARTRGNGAANGPHRGIVLLSTGLAVLGIVTGAAVSYFLYFGGAHS